MIAQAGTAILLSHCDTAQRVVAISSGSVAWFGRAADDIVGISVRDIVGPDGYSQIQPVIAGVLAGRETAAEIALALPQLGRRTVQCTCVPWRRNGAAGFLMALADVNVKADAAAVWAEAFARAEDARRAVEEIARKKDEFMAMVSHELRVPLNAVLGWAHILQGEPASVSHAAAVIERNARAMSVLVEDLLDAGRLAVGGSFKMQDEAVDIGRVIERAVEAIAPAADAKHVTIETSTAEAPLVVRGDAMRLQQAISNVLSNGVRHTPPRGRVTIEAAPRAQAVTISIRDTGDGIAATFIGTMFDAFEQGTSAASRGHRGLGLGLTIARDIIEQHAGAISADSSGPGAGATFTISIPRERIDPAVDAPPRRDAARAALASADTSIANVRVLYVADPADSTDLIRSVLEDANASVIVASDADAPAVLQNQTVDVLLCDIDVAAGTVQFLRTFSELRPVPSCALSSYARVGDRTQSLAAGFQTILRKPVECAELIAAIAGLALLSQSADRAKHGASTP